MASEVPIHSWAASGTDAAAPLGLGSTARVANPADAAAESALTSVAGCGSMRRTRAHWLGARMVNWMPSRAMRSSTERLTAVSASHMPSGRRPKRCSKSAMPQRIWVRASAFTRKRHDDVVVDLRHGRAVSAVTMGAELVRIENHAVGARGFIGEPTQQRRAEVKAHPRVVVHDADDLILHIGDAGGAVGSVALGGDAVVPIVVRRCGVLHLYRLQPGIFAGWLIEVAMNADVAQRAITGIGGCSAIFYGVLRRCSFQHKTLSLDYR